MRVVTHGATDQSVELYIVDADGLPATGLAYNSSGIDLWYRRNGAAVTSITEATQTASGAHSDGGFVGLGNGVYRLDPPDAAFASGVSHVTFGGTITSYTVYPVTVQLSAFDLQTATQAVNVTQFGGSNGTFSSGRPEVNTSHWGGTAVASASVRSNVIEFGGSFIVSSGGIPAVNVVQISSDTTAADNAESFFDGTGYAGTNNVIPTVTTTTNLTNKGDGSGFTAIPWNASWDAEVQSECTDALNAYDPPTNAEMEARTVASATYATASSIAALNNLSSAQAQTACTASIVAAGLDHLVSTSVTGTDIADNSIIARMSSKSATADWDSFVNTTDSLEAIRDNGGGGGGGGATAEEVADAVWDELASGHVTTGTFGALVMKNTDTIVLDESGVNDIADAVAEAVGSVSYTDVDQEPVSENRLIVLLSDDDEGLLGEKEKSLAVGATPTFAVDFRNDMAVNSWITEVDSVEISSGTSGGITFDNFGRDKSLAKFRATGVTAGAYVVKVTVTYYGGATAAGFITLNVVE